MRCKSSGLNFSPWLLDNGPFSKDTTVFLLLDILITATFFDTCASIPRLLRRGSTSVVDRTRPGANPTPNTHKAVQWRDETSLTCLSTWSETIAA